MFISFDGTISVQAVGTPPIEQFKPLRELIEPVAEPNRLIVVFVSMNGSNGYTALSTLVAMALGGSSEFL